MRTQLAAPTTATTNGISSAVWNASTLEDALWKIAPTIALPSTPPSWPLVFSTPEAAPATSGATNRTAVVVSGANSSPGPAATTTNPENSTGQLAVVPVERKITAIP